MSEAARVLAQLTCQNLPPPPPFSGTPPSSRSPQASFVRFDDGAQASRRAFARYCVDWTERRPHLAGALGAAIAARLLELEWVTRRPGSRALSITPAGGRELRARFGVG